MLFDWSDGRSNRFASHKCRVRKQRYIYDRDYECSFKMILVKLSLNCLIKFTIWEILALQVKLDY